MDPRRFVRWLPHIMVACWVIAAGAAVAGARQDPGSLPEYVVKAGFLYNFAKYVEWPVDAFEKADSPLSIGIVGADPFGEELEKALKDRTIRDRRLVIRRFADVDALEPCHMLFVPRTEKPRVAAILKKAGSWPVLTVGEDEGFARAGGTLSILIEKERSRIEVNPEEATKARLTINAKLLKVATPVKTER